MRCENDGGSFLCLVCVHCQIVCKLECILLLHHHLPVAVILFYFHYFFLGFYFVYHDCNQAITHTTRTRLYYYSMNESENNLSTFDAATFSMRILKTTTTTTEVCTKCKRKLMKLEMETHTKNEQRKTKTLQTI